MSASMPLSSGPLLAVMEILAGVCDCPPIPGMGIIPHSARSRLSLNVDCAAASASWDAFASSGVTNQFLLPPVAGAVPFLRKSGFFFSNSSGLSTGTGRPEESTGAPLPLASLHCWLATRLFSCCSYGPPRYFCCMVSSCCSSGLDWPSRITLGLAESNSASRFNTSIICMIISLDLVPEILRYWAVFLRYLY